MIELIQAQTLIRENTFPLPPELSNLEQSLGKKLAESVRADSFSPIFDHSAMDGIAARSSDLQKATSRDPCILEIKPLIAAGNTENFRLKPQTCQKIATGAKIPTEADTVIPKECFQEKDGIALIGQPFRCGQNIRLAGEHFKPREILLEAGTRLGSEQVALLASLGKHEVPVTRTIQTGIISTGTELIAPGKQLNNNQIYDSNSYMLAALAQECGASILSQSFVEDSFEVLRQNIEQTLQLTDILILSGGVSVGERDYVKPCLESLGVQTLFQKINVKPGKPMFFGVWKSGQKSVPVFGLPGNPAAAFLLFRHLIFPVFQKMGGQQPSTTIQAISCEDIRGSKQRAEIFTAQVYYDQGNPMFHLTPRQGAANIYALTKSNASFILPPDFQEIKKGTCVSLNLWR